jgi:hypothetical protein
MGDHPFAETRVRQTLEVLRPAGAPPSFTQLAVVLAGFNISMACNSACGPCNSNGDWVYSLNMSIADCSSPGGAAPATCAVEFGLGRGWTPTHGGGKPYNPCMSYAIEVFYTALAYDPAHTREISDLVVSNTTLFAPIETKTSFLPNLGGLAAVITGMTGFAWTLLETGGNADRGRYLERYAFSVSQPFRTGGGFAYAYTMGLADPAVTTVPSDALYRIVTSTLFTDGDEPHINPTLAARAVVCEDDHPTAFVCTKHGMQPALVDTVPVGGGPVA